MSVSSKIIELRERHDLTQKELADKININRSVLNRIEKGTRPVRDEELKSFANFFDVPIGYLLGENKVNQPYLSEEQEKMLNGFDSLNTDGQNILLNVLNSLRVTHSGLNGTGA